jgi:hypothetical protein
MDTAVPKTPDSAPGLRWFLFLEALVRLFLWNSSFAITIALLTALHSWPQQSLYGADLHLALQWSRLTGRFLIIFNLVYLAELLVFRALLPSPREGTYALVPGQRPSAQMLAMALVGILVKAKGQPPFPAFLLFHAANLPPFCWLVARIFGPRSRSVLVLDPPMPDPHLTEIGRNVVVGNMTSIIAHTQYGDHFELRKTKIEDDVMIGAHALIYSGCTIQRGAVVYGGAVVPPNTVIGPYEAWGGVPARKIRDLESPAVSREP